MLRYPEEAYAPCPLTLENNLQSELLQEYLKEERHISFADSRDYSGDSNFDFVKKHVYVKAEYCVSTLGFITGFELVANVTCEVCTSTDPKEDEGFLMGTLRSTECPLSLIDAC